MQISPEKLTLVKNEFFQNGRSVADWAREHQFPQSLVYAVLSGRSKARRGESHEIAVALGLKNQQSPANSRAEEEKH